MKKNIILSLVCTFILVFATSCCKDDTLTARKAKKLAQKELARTHSDTYYYPLTVGYYECNDNDTRYKLRQLAANEVITYSCERVKQTIQVRKSRRVLRSYYYYSYYDTEYYYDYDTIDTYFVTVDLTEKGKKLAIDSLPEPDKTKDELELRLDFKPDLSKYPEFNVDSIEFPVMKKTDNTRQEETEAVVDVEAVNEDYDEIVVDEPEYSKAEESYCDTIVMNNRAKRNEYEQAKAREHKEVIFVKAATIKIVKARNILSNPNTKTAKAEIIVECKESTPFGRILGGVYEGKRIKINETSYIYYEDKGWTLKEDDD